jgi:hypothetical protein
MIISNHYSEGLKERKDYELEEILEGLVDRHGREAVVGFLGGVCDGKAYQTANVWRDKNEASWWGEKAHKLWNI